VSEERVYTASGYFDKNMTTNHWIRSGSYFQSNRSGSETSDRNWLVVSATMKNMSSSVGMIIPNIWNVIKFMFQTTNQEASFFQLFVAPMLLLFFWKVCAFFRPNRSSFEHKSWSRLTRTMIGPFELFLWWKVLASDIYMYSIYIYINIWANSYIDPSVTSLASWLGLYPAIHLVSEQPMQSPLETWLILLLLNCEGYPMFCEWN
jgi:hypothetical protein